MTISLDHPALTLALAMLVGVLAQLAARHARVPGIVLLLATGVLLGPDVADVIRPELLGTGLAVIVGFAVAIILFEGGLNLRLEVLRAQARPIRRLVLIGGVVTAVLAALAARLVLGWDTRLSILFGTLVIVTGPTVVTPIVRRLRLQPNVGSILVAEGIFVDAFGATIAVVALQIALAPTRSEAAMGGLSIFLRFGVGGLVGLVGGVALVALLRVRYLVPHGLENILALAAAVTTFHASDAFVEESGITAAIVAGLVLGNVGFGRLAQVAEFKEQLTDLLVATLFVLLAADVRIADVTALGWQGAVVLALLVVVVRPACVFASTFGTDLTRREKLYLSWLAPRGIVAAAVASLFAADLANHGVAGGAEMRAMVFLVIAGSVTIQGLTAGPVADLLGVRLPARNGFFLLGANPLGRLMATTLTKAGARVVVIDANADNCAAARRVGLDVVEGDALSMGNVVAAGIDSYRHAVGLTPNEHINYLFARRIARDVRGTDVYVALERQDRGITADMAQRDEVGVLFGAETDLLGWLDRARRADVRVVRWRMTAEDAAQLAACPIEDVLPLVRVRRGEVDLLARGVEVREGDEVHVGVWRPSVAEASAWFEANGWTEIKPPGAAPASPTPGDAAASPATPA